MNKFLPYLLLITLVILSGCSSQSVDLGKSPEAIFNSKNMAMRSSGVVAADSLWIIKDGLQGEAGLYEGENALPIKSLSIDVNIIEFLASVDLSVSYSQIKPQNELTFKYPAFHGMLVRDFQVNIGERKFRAVISAKDSAEEIYQLAKKRGFNAVIVSQEAFGDMIVKTSIKEKSDIDILYSYTQLSSVSGKDRLIALPSFKGLENSSFNLKLRGSFISPLVSFSGLNKKIKGTKFFENIKDRNVIKNGLQLKYQVQNLHGVSSDQKYAIAWNSQLNIYEPKLVDGSESVAKCKEDILKPAFAFLELRELINKDKPFNEIQSHAIESKLLTPITRLLLIDAIK